MCPCISEMLMSLACFRNRKKARYTRDEGMRGNRQVIRSEPWATEDQVWMAFKAMECEVA